MKITYGIIEEKYLCGRSTRTSYGIAAFADDDEENGTSTIVASVHDILSDKQSIVDFIILCNRLNLSLVHLEDAVEDLLAK